MEKKNVPKKKIRASIKAAKSSDGSFEFVLASKKIAKLWEKIKMTFLTLILIKESICLISRAHFLNHENEFLEGNHMDFFERKRKGWDVLNKMNL